MMHAGAGLAVTTVVIPYASLVGCVLFCQVCVWGGCFRGQGDVFSSLVPVPPPLCQASATRDPLKVGEGDTNPLKVAALIVKICPSNRAPRIGKHNNKKNAERDEQSGLRIADRSSC